MDGAEYRAILEGKATKDWEGDSTSSKTMTLNIHPELQWNSNINLLEWPKVQT